MAILFIPIIKQTRKPHRTKAADRVKAMTAERNLLIAKARKKDDEKSGEATRAAFFMRALEKAHSFKNCYECRKAKP